MSKHFKLDKKEQEIIKELIENERASFKILKPKDRIPDGLKEYIRKLDSLEERVSSAGSL